MSVAHEPAPESGLNSTRVQDDVSHELINESSREPDGRGKDEKPGFTSILPHGVYRESKAWQSKDFLFPLLEPILAFGGVTSYFLIAIAAKSKHFGTAAFLSAVQALCVAIGRAPEESELLSRSRQIYLSAARRALPMLKFLDPEPPYQSRTRPMCVLIVPHGLYCIAGKRYWIEAISTQRQKVGKGWAFFADDKLCALSPMMKASARLCGTTKIHPVGNKHVVRAMKNSEDCVVFPGGFVEAALLRQLVCDSTLAHTDTGLIDAWSMGMTSALH
eukprot:gnl/MRDRNA2_/MRDRNA2_16812_c0_seq1.p1 gnl/MRDRNA2_/MRDRNA2_16812_c0~~gnl/MRDRNA2_/MRDRNA2_16812_c0_seq1.p1  ORF type:complete len:315 (+),score=44.02 gnl/MRDRNA2_/MRDRNA2_16812_c0_seq1:122-946(+)